ncbi:protein of unknown function UPF0227 [Rippkaea orientalis PCC 8801]|uniref:Esterase n=1 Tax=Rippkaea orientalis (strain PCC 8801 / RF-1) TaxID=41431 RepID=B7K1T4_RIPO1|nr:YqiA/YcfP family alpha/beta fold hydrolase [Rippkaea orientalis]ACK64241.1 protein of unknown function UPF0227 [Rippkaea orientalis PCC 8801]
MSNVTSIYIYLHGFASSPYSVKAQYLRDRFAQSQIPLILPDLNQGDFSNLTLTRQLQQVAAQFRETETPITLIGSSLGGLTAAWLGEKYPQVERLVLLAPAFGLLDRWLNRLGTTEVKQWEERGSLLVYHYGEKRSQPINYSFVTDTRQYPEHQLQRSVPTLILHGQRDDIVPIEYSRDYAKQRPWVELRELNSDHGLTDAMEQIWLAIAEFCQLL